ncbi:uncharacterized protein LOC130777124 [Actinidia eriantha]|uniref:uncharacterized protein LOC130777124 n=1 Tax=Actinidia eriantha TaxID=165200 RepID=UPI002590AEC8|nr:uncharacterized protein LOC130777124 [Actinidia eriantha]
MARLTIREQRKKRNRDVFIAVMCVMRTFNTILQMYMLIREFMGQRVERSPHIPLNPNVYQQQIDSLNRLVHSDDTTCHDQLRVNRHTFMRLCHLLMQRGLQDSRDVCVAEKVAIFLWILSHHTKNRRTKFQFIRSGETVSRHFNAVLLAVLRLHDVLWFHPEPVLSNDPEDRWKWFENCLGALDGTFIPVLPPAEMKARYRSRKGDYATNVLGVCSRNLRFIYALSGWEGSATDSRVLANALVRPHGLKIPHGYTNGPGLLAPYRSQRYHINIWRQGQLPQSKEEAFNMNHSAARNVVERCFGILKMRWGILRSYSYYPIRTQCRIVTACCLLHNFIKREMSIDPVEREYDMWEMHNMHNVPTEDPEDHITQVDTTNEWTEMRDNLANCMLANLMESQQSEQSNPNVGKAGKEKQPRRLWTSKEEEALLVAMLDCIGDKWKAHNGFKPGFFIVVEKELRKLLPGTTLRAKPNIESKVKGWKEKYGLLADMIRVSGSAWNHARQCVDVDDTIVWEEYERVNYLLFYFVC